MDGRVEKLDWDLIHYDYKGLDAWLNKHIWYSNLELNLYKGVYENSTELTGVQQKKRGFYYKLPMFFRARLYYWYRYYFQMGFLDGKPGKVFCFLQAYWYRFLIDAKLLEHSSEE